MLNSNPAIHHSLAVKHIVRTESDAFVAGNEWNMPASELLRVTPLTTQ